MTSRGATRVDSLRHAVTQAGVTSGIPANAALIDFNLTDKNETKIEQKRTIESKATNTKKKRILINQWFITLTVRSWDATILPSTVSSLANGTGAVIQIVVLVG
jgi:hypothetical protein